MAFVVVVVVVVVVVSVAAFSSNLCRFILSILKEFNCLKWGKASEINL